MQPKLESGHNVVEANLPDVELHVGLCTEYQVVLEEMFKGAHNRVSAFQDVLVPKLAKLLRSTRLDNCPQTEFVGTEDTCGLSTFGSKSFRIGNRMRSLRCWKRRAVSAHSWPHDGRRRRRNKSRI